MLEKVLVPTDFSPATEKVLEYVGGLKELGVKEVVLVHVSIRNGQEDFVLAERERRMTSRMEREKETLEKAGMKVSPIFLRGSPAPEILKVASKEKVSLIISGSHGKNPLDEVLMGSTSERIGRESTMPVMLVRYGILEEKSKAAIKNLAKKAFQKIIYPTDFSECSERAAEYIRQNLTKVGLKKVIVTHVVDDHHIVTISKKEKLRRQRRGQLLDIKERLVQAGLKVKEALLVGSPVAELLRIAGEEGATMIVMGSHGKGIFKETFLGSVSQEVIRMANKPVFIIH